MLVAFDITSIAYVFTPCNIMLSYIVYLTRTIRIKSRIKAYILFTYSPIFKNIKNDRFLEEIKKVFFKIYFGLLAQLNDFFAI